MNKNEQCVVKIEDMSLNGEGIGKVEGYTLFVKDAIMGDLARVKVTRAKKNYGYARLEELLEPSPFRTEPRCPHHRRCGGCQLQAMAYQKQLEWKFNKVKSNLERIGGLENIPMKEIIGMEDPWRYRNKAQYPVGWKKNGEGASLFSGKEIAAGFYASRTHVIIDSEECYLGQAVNGEILRIVKNYMAEQQAAPYEEQTGKGLVRHVLIRQGYHTGEIMVCLVVNGQELPGEQALTDRLRRIPGMTSIMLNVNRERTNVILGRTLRTLWGADHITDRIGDVTFSISPLSFFQVNSVQTEKLYGKVMEYVGAGQELPVIWDLYCGIGTISLFLAQRARQVYGVEVVPEAVADAKKNAADNGIDNVAFFVGKAEEVVPEKFASGKIRADVVVVDPPRKGCDGVLLETMVKMAPEKIVYVSCDSATLARDVKYLTEKGYEVKEVTPVDMFPMTVHVETVCLLSKLNVKQHIEVELTMDEMDLTAAEKKASYEEIKAYVLEKFGFKVSNLYIAQVKRKCGIIERENYNLSKSEDSRQPKCPPEKEAAIKEALEHFCMI